MRKTRTPDPLAEAIASVPDDEVEAAARAVYEHRFYEPHHLPWERCGPHWRNMHRTDAAIAIAAASLVNDRARKSRESATESAKGQVVLGSGEAT